MDASSFTLARTSAVLLQRWKTLLAFVVACVLVATITVFVVPPYFKSAATVVPGNAALADKGRIFNPNLRDLYSYFGTGDDLDRILGLADRDVSYLRLVDEFGLVNYFGLSGDSTNVLRKKASKCLRKTITVQKTEQGEVKITAWTKDKQLSAHLVNRMISVVEEAGRQIFQHNYNEQIKQFDSSLSLLQHEYIAAEDSARKSAHPQLAQLRLQQLQERMQSYSRIADEFRLASTSLPALLYVTEPAVPAAYAERPDKPAIIIAAALLGLLFGCVVLLVNDRKATS